MFINVDNRGQNDSMFACAKKLVLRIVWVGHSDYTKEGRNQYQCICVEYYQEGNVMK